MVAYCYAPLFDGHIDALAKPHHVFVDGVVQHLFQQDIDTIVGMTAVA